MTIKLVENSENATLRVAVSGKLSSDDYTTFEPAVTQLVKSAGKIKILFVMQDFHGWEPGAVWEDIKFATKHCHDIDRIAMVGEKAWERWMAKICRPFTMSKIRYFEAGQEDAAREWLETTDNPSS